MWLRRDTTGLTADEVRLFQAVESLYAGAGSRLDRIFVLGALCETPFARMARFVPDQGLVVDLGCGRGEFTNYLALSGAGREVLGVDLASDRIEIANRTVRGRPNIRFEVRDVRRVDLLECACVVLSEILYLIDLRREH